jgi:hypothetical protein
VCMGWRGVRAAVRDAEPESVGGRNAEARSVITKRGSRTSLPPGAATYAVSSCADLYSCSSSTRCAHSARIARFCALSFDSKSADGGGGGRGVAMVHRSMAVRQLRVGWGRGGRVAARWGGGGAGCGAVLTNLS